MKLESDLKPPSTINSLRSAPATKQAAVLIDMDETIQVPIGNKVDF